MPTEPHKPTHAGGSSHPGGQAGGAHRATDQIQGELDQLKEQLVKAIPEIEADAAKQRRQLERIAAAQAKWTLTHEPEDPFDPTAFEPPMVPLKIDPAKQKAFHALHYKIAQKEQELAAAVKAATGGNLT